MNKYFIKRNETDKPTELILNGSDKALLNGIEYKYEHEFINENVLSLRVNNKNYFLDISESDADSTVVVNNNSKEFSIECKSELELMLEKMNGNKKTDKLKNEIFSPMPGIIKKLNVTEGQKIAKGEVMLVLEAMKMENEIKAVKDCVVKKVNVGEMSSVEKNQLLIVIE